MELKEFIDKGGVVVVNNEKDLGKVIETSRGLGYRAADQYIWISDYPLFFRVMDGVLLPKEETKRNPLVIGVDEFLSNAEMIFQKIKECKGKAVYVKCDNEDEMRSCYDHFTRMTRQKGWSGGYTTLMPYFSLQSGHPYPSYCLEKDDEIITFEEFRRRYIEAPRKGNLIEILDKIDIIMKGLSGLKKMVENDMNL